MYILAGKSAVLYVGMTNNLPRRMQEHHEKQHPSFTCKYDVTKLVWFEPHAGAASAIAREKQLKGWKRSRKVALIEANNSAWLDLSRYL